MDERPDLSSIHKPAEEALQRLHLFRAQNPLLVTCLPTSRAPSSSTMPSTAPSAPGHTQVETNSRRFDPSRMVIPPTAYARGHMPPSTGDMSQPSDHMPSSANDMPPFTGDIPRSTDRILPPAVHMPLSTGQPQFTGNMPQSANNMLPPAGNMPLPTGQPQSTGNTHQSTANMPSVAATSTHLTPYTPRIYPEPLSEISREMVFDRIYLVLRDNLPEWWTRNHEALAHITVCMTDDLIRDGQLGAFGPDGLDSLTQIFVGIGHEGIHHYMCLAVEPREGNVRVFLKGDLCEQDGKDPMLDPAVMELCREGFDRQASSLYAMITRRHARIGLTGRPGF